MSCQVLSEAPQYLGKFRYNFLFSTAACICVLTWCIAVSVDLPGFEADCYICRGNTPVIPDIHIHQFLHLFCMNDSRLTRWYPLHLVKLAFLGTGINVILNCNQALGMYIQGPPEKCIRTLTKENSMLYFGTNFNYTSQVEYTLQQSTIQVSCTCRGNGGAQSGCR